MPFAVRTTTQVVKLPVKRRKHVRSRPIPLGTRFGNLVVIEDLGIRACGDAIRHAYLCSCSCGNEPVITGMNLLAGQKSCGCMRISLPVTARYAALRQPLCQCRHPAIHYDLDGLCLCVWCGRAV